MRAINVVGAEFTMSGELNDLGVEENNVIFEQIFDNLDLETDTCDLVHNIQPENDLSPTTSNVTQHNNGEEQVNDSINENPLTIIPDANENKINEENANRNALNDSQDENIETQFYEEINNENDQNNTKTNDKKINKKVCLRVGRKTKFKKLE